MTLRGAVIAFALLHTGCGGEFADTVRTDATAADDTATGDARELDNVTGIPRCGPGPWILHREALSGSWGMRRPLQGAKVTTDLCPEIKQVTGEDGMFAFAMTRGRPFVVFYDHPATGRMAFGPYTGLVNVDSRGYTFHGSGYPLRDGALAIVPWRQDFPPPCGGANRLKVWVENFPDAGIHYYRNGVETFTDDLAGEQTIIIDGVPPVTDLDIRGAQPGCTVVPRLTAAVSDRGRVYPGYRSGFALEIFPPPDGGSGEAGLVDAALDDADAGSGG